MNKKYSLIEQLKRRSFLELLGVILTVFLFSTAGFYFASLYTSPVTPEPEVQRAESLPDTILAACPPKAHKTAFREGQMPDLTRLGINLCYELELELSEEGDRFEATAKITARNEYDYAWPHLLFRLYPHSRLVFGGDIDIKEVKVDGELVESKRVLSDRTGLYVPLAQPLTRGKSVEVTLAFTGILHEYGKNPAAYGLFSRSESAITLASWYPMLAVWDDEQGVWYDSLPQNVGDAVFAESAYVQAKVSFPERFDLASSGVTWREDRENGRKIAIIAGGPVRDLPLVWLEGYEHITVEANFEVTEESTVIRSWYKPSQDAAAYTALNTAKEALLLFNQNFGPYPFKELELVPVPLWNWGGMEYPQLILLADHYYDPNSPTQVELPNLVAHETAHQWWYSAIGSNVYESPWQDEALAEWSVLLWLEQVHGLEAAQYRQAQLQYMFDQLQNIKGNQPLAQTTEQLQGDPNVYYALIYGKGALFLNQLRQEIGNDIFLTALSDYYQANRFAIADSADLLTIFETHSQRSLHKIYRDWGIQKREEGKSLLLEEVNQ